MSPEQIEELFISAAETERRLPPMGERPARLKAQNIPYFHTEDDIKGWGGERFKEERANFLDLKTTRIRAGDISRWELCNELVTFVRRERDRRCLWAWAYCQATSKSFSAWCRDKERIHRNTGTACKDAAVSSIASLFLRKTLADIQKAESCTLHDDPIFSDKGSNIDEPRKWSWMAEGAFSAREVPEAQNFDWSEKRNKQRRQRREQKAKAQGEQIAR